MGARAQHREGLLEQAGGDGRRPSSTAGCSTGDLARLDEEGFCFIIDRAKDMLIRGGENIYCIEVENVLYEHPAVMDAALVGIPHKTLGEEPGAVVHLKPGSTRPKTNCAPSSPASSPPSRCR